MWTLCAWGRVLSSLCSTCPSTRLGTTRTRLGSTTSWMASTMSQSALQAFMALSLDGKTLDELLKFEAGLVNATHKLDDLAHAFSEMKPKMEEAATDCVNIAYASDKRSTAVSCGCSLEGLLQTEGVVLA